VIAKRDFLIESPAFSVFLKYILIDFSHIFPENSPYCNSNSKYSCQKSDTDFSFLSASNLYFNIPKRYGRLNMLKSGDDLLTKKDWLMILLKRMDQKILRT